MTALIPLMLTLTATGWQPTAERWAAVRFGGEAPDPRPAVGLTVLANNDPVQLNSRHGRPLRMAGQTYVRGLYCHADSRVVVRLPAGATRFEAVVGVDSNEQTSGGRGSVVFSVWSEDQARWTSDTLREGQAPVDCAVELGGADTFELRVGDAGDGISCDQANWAEARVTMADGTTLWLADLPLLGDLSADESPEPPFDFLLDGASWRAQAATWTQERVTVAFPDATRYTVTWRQPAGPLVVAAEAFAWRDAPVVEWTVWLRNAGAAPSGQVSDLRGADVQFGAGGGWTLHHNTGSICEARDFEPLATPLTPAAPAHLAPAGGRGSNGVWPYVNLTSAGGRGVIAAIGWPGQWAADFAVDAQHTLRLRAGQELTSFCLAPGEAARTPLIALLWHAGDVTAAQNQWRRYMLAHVQPRDAAGEVLPPQFNACSSHQYGEMVNADEASQLLFVDRYTDHGLQLDHWWMDAGWYPAKEWWLTGTWEVDRARFPRGLRSISDHARERGVGTLVWFEPERVMPGTWLAEQHPEWLLGPAEGPMFLNLGDPAAHSWLVEHIDGLLRSEGIDFYRQDFNADPLGAWRANDAPERQGLTENLYIQGYLAYWDELRRRHPGLPIDSCASGGRRNDLESMKRAVPLLRSDYIFEPIGQQCHTLGLAPWLPYYGTGVRASAAYEARSNFCPAINTCWDVRPDDEAEFAARRARIADWRLLGDLWSGDFYPLLPYTRDPDAWAAWQWHRPDLERGALQVFRRAESPYETARMRLQGLDPARRYRLTDADLGDLGAFAGADLVTAGLPVTCAQAGVAALITYEALPD